MIPPSFLWIALVLVFCFPLNTSPEESPSRYTLMEQNGAWRILQNGSPFFIQGAVGSQSMDMLRDYGANSVRIGSNRASLDKAQEYGLTAMVGLPVRGERNGIDWNDDSMVSEQRQKVLALVDELKNHPAVMIWAVGNELDHIPPDEPYHPILWERLNDLAKDIKARDPHHLVLTVVGTGHFERKIQEIAADCPDMDLLGINAYGDLDNVTRLARQYWKKPYVIAEWGPTGHWQTPKTEWRAAIEQTSTEKAQSVYERYANILLKDSSHCLGSYVFYWAEKQETTHTWYGLFRDGMKTESIDVMKFFWSGDWPENRAPAVLGIVIHGFPDKKKIFLQSDTTYTAHSFAYDPDLDSLTFTWDIRPEVVIPRNSYAGSHEKAALPIPGLIGDTSGPAVQFTTPAEKGAYRLFLQVTDGKQSTGYANLPFYVGEQ